MFRNLPKIACLVVVVLFACGKHHDDSGVPSGVRTYRMGFMNSAPRLDFNEYIQSFNIWTSHADATIISTEVPWDSLLNGESAIAFVAHNYLDVVKICRSKNMQIWVYIDPENGLDRQSDAVALARHGKSIAQADAQAIYRRFVVVADSILHPDHLGLALETNLIRVAAPTSIYQGVRTAANAAAADVKAVDPKVLLSVSVQAEVAWGKLGSNTSYAGIDADLTDFPFIQEVGISSYAYLGFSSPSDIPLNYYSRLVDGHKLPVFVSEGGWTSANLTDLGIQSNPFKQQDYLRRQAQVLTQAKAIGVFQLTFTDLALSGWPASDSAGLYPFAFLGMVDSNFVDKPVFATWDSLRQLPFFQP